MGVPFPALQARVPDAPPNPLEQYAQIQGIRGMQQNQQIRQMQMDEMKREQEDQTKLRTVLSDPSIDWTKPEEALQTVLKNATQIKVDPQMILKVRESLTAEADKRMKFDDSKKARIRETNSLLYHTANSIQDPQTYAQARAQLISQGLVGPNDMPEQYDPAWVALHRGAIGATEATFTLMEGAAKKKADLDKAEAEAEKATKENESVALMRKQYVSQNPNATEMDFQRQLANMKESKTTDSVRFENNWMATNRLQDTPENRFKAQMEYIKQNKTVPGILRMEALGDVRPMGNGVYDSKLDMTIPMTVNQYKKAASAEPGRYRSPQYDVELQGTLAGAKATGREFAVGTESDQLAAFRTFARHSATLAKASDEFTRTNSALANRPINWLRKNAMDDPQVRAYIAAITPPGMEYYNILKNNRALYVEDEDKINDLVNENVPPKAMRAVLNTFGHITVQRMETLNLKSKEAPGRGGKGITLDPGTVNALNELGVGVQGYGFEMGQGGASGGGATVTNTPSQKAVSDAVAKFRAKQAK